MERVSVVVLAVILLVGLALAGKGSAHLPSDPREIPHEAQLASTRARADLDGDGRQEELLLINALTGEQHAERASEVVLGILGPGEDGELLWVRHVMRETGKPAHDGELTAIDLDGDSASELILTWDRSLTADRVDRWAEIYAISDAAAPTRVWEGPWLLDNRRTESALESDRQHMIRDIDYSATRRAAGRAIVFRKVHKMIAGELLDPPKETVERVAISLRSWAQ